MLGVHAGTALLDAGILEQFLEAVAMKDVVAEHQRGGGGVEKGFADQEGSGEAVWVRLYRLAQLQASLAAVAQQLLETLGVLRGGGE